MSQVPTVQIHLLDYQSLYSDFVGSSCPERYNTGVILLPQELEKLMRLAKEPVSLEVFYGVPGAKIPGVYQGLARRRYEP